VVAVAAGGVLAGASPALAQVTPITYQPYIQPGDTSRFDDHDRVVVAWQSQQAAPTPNAYVVEFVRVSDRDADGDPFKSAEDGESVSAVGRVVDNYLAADPSLPVPPTAPGPRVNYYAVLDGLAFDTAYAYRVFGPGLPDAGFQASFRTRKRSGRFSFLVQGDEGFFPVESGTPARIADFEARIIHLMNDVQHIELPGIESLPDADLALNTGDNVYTFGSESNYRDFWFPVWNSEVDSNETGAPFIRRKLFYIVAGNHDVGSTGVNVNLIGNDTSPRFSGNADGGDALAYFNNFYFPLNGPSGVDPEFTWNADTVTDNGFLFSFKGQTFTSPAAIEALRAATTVNTGGGVERQIDHMTNYSFDSGNAHFLFLDANPHLFNSILDGAAVSAAAPDAFPSYPSILRKFVIDDLDASHQTWKVVVFHQPAFSSGLATLRNSQMRAVAKVLEDHGVNIVFNGHEHNYQRTLPLRALATAAAPATASGDPAVAVDADFDGVTNTVPDGVLYIVEGAGGNRDFDGDEAPARGSGLGLDQDDSATGTFTVSPTLTVAQGPASWLDTHLTDTEMTPLFAGAGTGPKITVRFKSKVFSFADIVADEDRFTLFQITEPLRSTSSATPQNPAPFGTGADGQRLNDPIGDTLIDPTTGQVVSAPETGTPALLDKFSVRKPDLDDMTAVVIGPAAVFGGKTATFDVHVANRSRFALNGTQVVFTLPEGTDFAGVVDDHTTVQGREVVTTVGRLEKGASVDVSLPLVVAHRRDLGVLAARAVVRSSTAQPVSALPAFSGRGE
jgi:hypothetical protein